MFTDEELARFTREWGRAVDAASRSLDDTDVRTQWSAATAFAPAEPEAESPAED